jgi:hypothetical protein
MKWNVATTLVGLMALATMMAGCANVSALGQQAQATTSRAALSISEVQAGWVTAADITVTPGPVEVTTSDAGSPPVTDEPTPQGDNLANFSGTVQNAPSGANWTGTWQISGRTVRVSSSTAIEQTVGALGKGAVCDVEGWTLPDGSVDAGWIHVLSGAPSQATPTPGAVSRAATATLAPAQPGPDASPAPSAPAVPGQGHGSASQASVKPPAQRHIVLRGWIESLPQPGVVGTWRVSGRNVNVSAATRIRQQHWALGREAFVQVLGWQRPDGSIDAAQIETKNPKSAGSGEQGNGSQPGAPNGNGKGRGNGQGNGQGGGD